jgi:hypothetical protein
MLLLIFRKTWSSFHLLQNLLHIQSSNILRVSIDFRRLLVLYEQFYQQNLIISANADYLVRHLPDIQKQIGNFFNVHKLFSNERIFSNLGKILCGKPFPRSNNIRFVNNIIYSPDYNGADKDELEVMPSNII